jgi:hypothetical protein
MIYPILKVRKGRQGSVSVRMMDGRSWFFDASTRLQGRYIVRILRFHQGLGVIKASERVRYYGSSRQFLRFMSDPVLRYVRSTPLKRSPMTMIGRMQRLFHDENASFQAMNSTLNEGAS